MHSLLAEPPRVELLQDPGTRFQFPQYLPTLDIANLLLFPTPGIVAIGLNYLEKGLADGVIHWSDLEGAQAANYSIARMLETLMNQKGKELKVFHQQISRIREYETHQTLPLSSDQAEG